MELDNNMLAILQELPIAKRLELMRLILADKPKAPTKKAKKAKRDPSSNQWNSFVTMARPWEDTELVARIVAAGIPDHEFEVHTSKTGNAYASVSIKYQDAAGYSSHVGLKRHALIAQGLGVIKFLGNEDNPSLYFISNEPKYKGVYREVEEYGMVGCEFQEHKEFNLR